MDESEALTIELLDQCVKAQGQMLKLKKPFSHTVFFSCSRLIELSLKPVDDWTNLVYT